MVGVAEIEPMPVVNKERRFGKLDWRDPVSARRTFSKPHLPGAY
jgi:hypothetical protein